MSCAGCVKGKSNEGNGQGGGSWEWGEYVLKNEWEKKWTTMRARVFHRKQRGKDKA